MIPLVSSAVLDPHNHFTKPWRDWFLTLERTGGAAATVSYVDTQVADLAAQISSTQYKAGAGISIFGDPVKYIALDTVPNEGADTLYMVQVDQYGRVFGFAEATAADLPYDNATSGLTADDVQAAIDELSAEKLDDAPSDGSTYGRKDAAWVAVTAGDVPITDAGGYFSGSDVETALQELGAGGGGGGQAAIQFKDEGSNIGTSGAVTAVDFTGTGVTATETGGVVTVAIASGGGSGDVVGPASSTDSYPALFDGTTGKLIKQGTGTLGTAAYTAASAYATAAQGAKADSAVQSVVAGTNVTVDNTDPQNPVVSASGGGGGMLLGYAKTTATTTGTTSSTIPNDNTIPQDTEGAAYTALDLTYAPTSASSQLEIEVSIPFISGAGVVSFVLSLFESGVANAISTTFYTFPSANYASQINLRAVVSAASTSSRTYTLRFGNAGGSTNVYIQTNGSGPRFGAASTGYMTLKEIG